MQFIYIGICTFVCMHMWIAAQIHSYLPHLPISSFHGSALFTYPSFAIFLIDFAHSIPHKPTRAHTCMYLIVRTHALYIFLLFVDILFCSTHLRPLRSSHSRDITPFHSACLTAESSGSGCVPSTRVWVCFYLPFIYIPLCTRFVRFQHTRISTGKAMLAGRWRALKFTLRF